MYRQFGLCKQKPQTYGGQSLGMSAVFHTLGEQEGGY